jgi:hypothetical protein
VISPCHKAAYLLLTLTTTGARERTNRSLRAPLAGVLSPEPSKNNKEPPICPSGMS